MSTKRPLCFRGQNRPQYRGYFPYFCSCASVHETICFIEQVPRRCAACRNGGLPPCFQIQTYPLPLSWKKFLDGKRKKIATRKKKMLQVSSIFLQEIRSRREIVTSPPTSKLYSNKNPHTERVSRFPVHFDFLFLLFTASCIYFSNFSAICCPYLSKSTLGACPRCNLYK